MTPAWSGAQKHFQCHDPTSYPKSTSPKWTCFPPALLSTLFPAFCCVKTSQAAQGVHTQPTAWRRALSKISFPFLFPYDHVFHPSSSSPRYRPTMAHIMPEAAVLCCKNRCFFNCPSHRHNWWNEETHKIGCSTRVKGGSFPQLQREGKKISLSQPENVVIYRDPLKFTFQGHN